MGKMMKKQLNRAKMWWKKTSWFEKAVSLFRFLYGLHRFVGWVQEKIPTVWPIIEEYLKNLL